MCPLLEEGFNPAHLVSKLGIQSMMERLDLIVNLGVRLLELLCNGLVVLLLTRLKCLHGAGQLLNLGFHGGGSGLDLFFHDTILRASFFRELGQDFLFEGSFNGSHLADRHFFVSFGDFAMGHHAAMDHFFPAVWKLGPDL